MPQSPDHPFVLKNRLIGAAVLILVAVVFLPYFLTGQERIHRRTAARSDSGIPQIQPSFVSRIEVATEISSKPHKKNSSYEGSDAAISIGSPEPGVELTREKRNDGQAVVAGTNAETSGWVVQVGVFQNPQNAQKRFALLSENGFAFKTEKTELDGNSAVRVFLGPFLSEMEADRKRAQVVMITNDRAFVARYP